MRPPQADPARRCLPVSDWPDADQAAWHAALSSDDPLSNAAQPPLGNLPLVTRIAAATAVG
jgi:hypothetical protein